MCGIQNDSIGEQRLPIVGPIVTTYSNVSTKFIELAPSS